MSRTLAVVAFAALLATLAVAMKPKVVEKDLGNGMKRYEATHGKRAPHVKPDSTSTSSTDGIVEQPETQMYIVTNYCACQLTLVPGSAVVGTGSWNVAPPPQLYSGAGFEARVAQFSANMSSQVTYTCSSWPAATPNLTIGFFSEMGMWGSSWGLAAGVPTRLEIVYTGRTTLYGLQIGSSDKVVC